MLTETAEDIELDLAPYEDTDDGQDHLSHLINSQKNAHIWQPGMSSQDIIEIARMTGTFVETLCGYRLVPRRNPKLYPVCQTCVDIATNMVIGGA